MENSSDMVFIYLFLTAVVLSLMGYFVYEKRRSEAMLMVAKSLGLSFSKAGRDLSYEKHRKFPLFSQGSGRKIKNEMWGEHNGVAFTVFGYEYTEGSGESSATYKQTVISFDIPYADFPSFELRPENIFHKIGQMFGYQDIDFDASPAFSKIYLLRGNDERNIRQVFNRSAIKFFESNKNLCVEVQSGTLLFYRRYERRKPSSIQEFVLEGEAVYRVFFKS